MIAFAKFVEYLLDGLYVLDVTVTCSNGVLCL